MLVHKKNLDILNVLLWTLFSETAYVIYFD